MNDLLKEIEAIVFSGTRLNLDYYIDEVLDEHHQDQIYEYFKEEAESESIEEGLIQDQILTYSSCDSYEMDNDIKRINQ